jgi:hypothetical protein
MDAATCKSRVLDSISTTDRRLWRLSDFYPVVCCSDNEDNKKFLILCEGTRRTCLPEDNTRRVK